MLALTLTVAMATTQVVSLVPGKSLAGVQLGASEASVKQQGLTPNPQMTGWYERKAKDARWPALAVRVEEGKVTDIDATLAADAVVDWGAGAGKPGESMAELAARFGRCGGIDHRIGGSWTQCEDGVAFVETMAGRGIRLQSKPAPLPGPRCSDYAEGPGNLDVKPGRTVCLGKVAFTTATTLAQVEANQAFGFCETVRDQAGATRRCRQTHFLFTPAGTLRRIEISAVR